MLREAVIKDMSMAMEAVVGRLNCMMAVDCRLYVLGWYLERVLEVIIEYRIIDRNLNSRVCM